MPGGASETFGSDFSRRAMTVSFYPTRASRPSRNGAARSGGAREIADARSGAFQPFLAGVSFRVPRARGPKRAACSSSRGLDFELDLRDHARLEANADL